MVNAEYWLNRVSMVCLLGGGLFFIYEGAQYIDMKRQNPNKVPDKMYVAGIFTIILGLVSIGFGLFHLWVPTDIVAEPVKNIMKN